MPVQTSQDELLESFFHTPVPLLWCSSRVPVWHRLTAAVFFSCPTTSQHLIITTLPPCSLLLLCLARISTILMETKLCHVTTIIKAVYSLSVPSRVSSLRLWPRKLSVISLISSPASCQSKTGTCKTRVTLETDLPPRPLIICALDGWRTWASSAQSPEF